MPRSYLIPLFLLLLLLPGCGAPTRTTGAIDQVKAGEQVTYEVDTDPNGVLKDAHTDLQPMGALELEGSFAGITYVVKAHGSFDHPALNRGTPPSAADANISFDLETGTRSRIEQPLS